MGGTEDEEDVDSMNVDKHTIRALEECLSQENPAAWLEAHPEWAGTLAPYLGVSAAVRADIAQHNLAAEPSPAAVAAGQTRLFAALSDVRDGNLRAIRPPARVAAMVAGAAAAVAVIAWGSVAFGGAGFGQAVLDAVMGPTEEQQEGINNAPSEADSGREHGNDNAFEGSGNAEDGSGNGAAAPDCQPADPAEIAENANANAAERCDNAPDGQGNAGDKPTPPATHPTPPATPPTPPAQDGGPPATPPTPPATPSTPPATPPTPPNQGGGPPQ